VQAICVFCGASAGDDPVYAEAAAGLGRELTRRGIGLVTGGGRVGLMGAVADAALAAGGEVTGVIPQALLERELAHTGLTRLHVVPTLHERKALMHELADGFVALPGGFGTLDELMEAITWAQLGLHAKPIGILDVQGYYDALLGFVEHARRSGFVPERHRPLLVVAGEPRTLLDALGA
jgi:uncharacterized protein (TIGR00730 family)